MVDSPLFLHRLEILHIQLQTLFGRLSAISRLDIGVMFPDSLIKLTLHDQWDEDVVETEERIKMYLGRLDPEEFRSGWITLPGMTEAGFWYSYRKGILRMLMRLCDVSAERLPLLQRVHYVSDFWSRRGWGQHDPFDMSDSRINGPLLGISAVSIIKRDRDGDFLLFLCNLSNSNRFQTMWTTPKPVKLDNQEIEDIWNWFTDWHDLNDGETPDLTEEDYESICNSIERLLGYVAYLKNEGTNIYTVLTDCLYFVIQSTVVGYSWMTVSLNIAQIRDLIQFRSLHLARIPYFHGAYDTNI
jgi:hypothetical protein